MPDFARQDFFDGTHMINALTLLWLACLIPREAFGANLLFTVSLHTFMVVAIVNHLFPQRLAPLTHVVKALYSVLLLVSLKANMVLAIPLVLLDLVPLVSQRAAFSESVGAICRLGCVAIGFSRTGFSPSLLSFYVLMSAVYFAERRARIRRGRRHEYGWFHHFEHLALVAFLLAVNRDILNLRWTYLAIIIAPFIVFSAFIALGLFTNQRLKNAALPAWFDRKLATQFRNKLLGNANSLKLYNYFFKPFDHALLLRKVSWADIERIVDSVPVSEPVDEVVGIFSGGAFISSYVAQRNGIPKVSYVRSSYWSASNLTSLIAKIINHLADRPVASNVELPSDLQIENKVVLLVDDTICTSVTSNSVAGRLYALGAKKVLRYALFCSSAAKADYVGIVSGAPIIWPWGWEAD